MEKSNRTHICPECRREFQSIKALHGHLKVHPRKGYREESRRTKKAPIENATADEVTAAEMLVVLQDGNEASASRPAYHCSACDRSFDTHRALGGHMTSHKKHKKNNFGPSEARNEDSGTAAHECDVCGKVFDRGVSLGGHKRKHFLERERAKVSGIEPSGVPKATSTNRPFYLDLNVVPNVDDEWKLRKN